MKIVVGLGNPGARYAATRHNVGARIVDRFALERGILMTDRRFNSRFGRGRLPRGAGESPERPDLDVGLLVPETSMNRSGEAVAEALRGLPVEAVHEDLLVVVDDLDLPFGRLRIRPQGGSAGHRGLEDIAERIGTSEFPRLRFGIGRPEVEISAVDWVLESFSEAEDVALQERIPLAAEAVAAILIDGVVPSMNRYNRGSDAGE